VPGTAAQAPNIPLGFADIIWTDWWLVLLGVSFVVVTIYAPQGLGGLVDRLAPQRKN
jgi:urea transport system permease protein